MKINFSSKVYSKSLLKGAIFVVYLVIKSLKEMCIYISMSIIEKVFKYEATELPVIKYEDEIWFKAVIVATILKYTNQRKAIRDHVDLEDKRKLSEIGLGSKRNESFPFKGNGGECIYINESGLYSLIFGSKLESAKAFKRWVTKDVLPSIRKTGRYDHKYSNMLTFKIENETDLHVKVVSFLKKRYPNSLFTVTLGENQDTSFKRINSFRKGYQRGSPDLVIHNLNKYYTGFCIEFKSPKGNGVLSSDQAIMLRKYQDNGFKTLVSNDYDQIIEQIIDYFRNVGIRCLHCSRIFNGSQSLNKHIKGFHKM